MDSIVVLSYTRDSGDEAVALLALVLLYAVFFPLRLLVERFTRTKRLRSRLVTSGYKAPRKLSPAEISYLFSPHVSRRHIHATLLDLANRGVLHMERDTSGKIMIDMGPRITRELAPHEKLLVNYVYAIGDKVPLQRLLDGDTSYKLSNGDIVKGSRVYVVWWLVRESLRDQKLINKSMKYRYVQILLDFSALRSLAVTVGFAVAVRFGYMLLDGQVDFSLLVTAFVNGLQVWILAVPAIIVLGFFLLRFKGTVTTRRWLLAPHFVSSVQQLVGFKDFVRLCHQGKLRFESKELQDEILLETKPHAIAFGYVKPDQ